MSVLDAPTADVAAYAADVRRALSGLTPEQVDDLTDDLEQTLADALADDHRSGAGVGLVGMFGPPTADADELRDAAGLDELPARRRSLRDRLAGVRGSLVERVAPLRAQPWWPGLADFVRSLAPVWWVLRAWAIYQALDTWFTPGPLGILPGSLFGWVAFGVITLVSVQWGRGLWRRGGLLNVLFWVTSVFAVLALPALLSNASSDAWASPDGYAQAPMPPADGVYVGGSLVPNLFVYDAEGNPVSGAQVFDDQGRPVATTSDAGGYWYDELFGTTVQLVPATATDGSQRWNAYPLRTQELNDEDPDAPGVVADPLWPFAQAGAILLPPPGPAAPDDADAPSVTPSASAPSDAASAPAATKAPKG
jgi:hypothetical protein